MTVKPDDAQFLTQLRDSATGQRLAAEIEARRVADRTAHAAAMAKIDLVDEPENVRGWAENDRLCKARDALERQWREAAAKAAHAVAVNASAGYQRMWQRQQHEAHLTETCDPAVAAFIRWCWDEIPATHKLFDEMVVEDRNRLLRTRDQKVITNRDDVDRRVGAIREVIAEAEALRLRPDQSGVAARLDFLRDSLPVVKSIRPPPAPPADKKGNKP